MSEKMSISNLNKNAGVTTGSGISYQTIASDDNITTLENPNIKPARTVADLSSLPQKEDTHEGIIIKESIEDEVFGEGGVFEEYLEEARKEREEMDAAIDAHNEMVAAELGEEVPDEITDEDVIRSTEAINNKENPLDEIETEVEDPSDYVDPLERELEAEEEEEIAINNKFKQSMSNIDAVQEQTKLSNNSIANTIKSEDLGQGVKIKYIRTFNDSMENKRVVDEIQKLYEEGYNRKDMAIFYRTNAQSRSIEDALVKANIPYKVFGSFYFYKRKEIKDLLAYLKLIANPSDDVSLERVINEPKRKIGDKTIENLREKARSLNISMFEAIDSGKELEFKNLI